MSKRYKALQSKRADRLAKAKALLNPDNEATPSAEATAEANAILATEIPAIDAELAQLDALHEAERRAPATASGITVHDNSQDDPRRGFASLAEFAMAVRAASPGGGGRLIVDPRLAGPTGQMSEGGSSGESYDLPPAFRNDIWSHVFAEDGLLGQFTMEPTESNTVELIADEATPWGSAGVQSYWRTESQQMNASKLASKGRAVKLGELYAYVLATSELMEDAPRLGARLSKSASDALAWKLLEALMWGDGIGKPLGWMKAACLVTVAKESSQSAAGIIADNIAKMYSRQIDPGGSVWFANQDCLPQLMVMQLGNQPIWTPPATGFANAPGGFLLGRPVQFTEHNETMGTLGDIQLVSPKGYYGTIKSGGTKFASSIHLFFDYNVEAFRWILRAGGQPFLSAAVSPAKGSNTKSHFVALAARP